MNIVIYNRKKKAKEYHYLHLSGPLLNGLIFFFYYKSVYVQQSIEPHGLDVLCDIHELFHAFLSECLKHTERHDIFFLSATSYQRFPCVY